MMQNKFEVKILQLAHCDLVYHYAQNIEQKATRAVASPDPIEMEMLSWTSPWRKESLEHYLPQGWSFGAFDSSDNLHGFILAQPLLFVTQMTQSLWVEYLVADSPAEFHLLLETAYRWARDKHLQQILINPAVQLEAGSAGFDVVTMAGQLRFIKTSRFV